MGIWSDVVGLGGGFGDDPIIYCNIVYDIAYIITGEIIIDEFTEVLG